jgi:hypothetical protein
VKGLPFSVILIEFSEIISKPSCSISFNFSKVYHERILSKKYTVRNIGNPESNNYEVEYKTDNEEGFVLAVVNYNFRERDFTLDLESVNYHNKKTGEVTLITSRNTIDAVSKYYQTTKKLLLTLQSNYISPDLNK